MHLSAILLSLTTLTLADDYMTWTKPGAQFRQRSAQLENQTIVETQTYTHIPTTTLALRSIPSATEIRRPAPMKRAVKRDMPAAAKYKNMPALPKTSSVKTSKRADLSPWWSQGCAKVDGGIPPMASPFPCQLQPSDVSSETCIKFCDQRGDNLAAMINGNECWYGGSSSGCRFVDMKECNVHCAGDKGENCGGKDMMSVWAKPGNRYSG